MAHLQAPSAGSERLPASSRRVARWRGRGAIAVTAVLLALFAGWCVRLMADVGRLRSGVEARVGLLVALQRAQAHLAGGEVGAAPDPAALARAVGEARRAVEDVRAGLERLEGPEAGRDEAVARAAAALDRLAVAEAPARAALAREGAAALDEAVRAIRRENARLSAELGSRWVEINALAGLSLALAACVLALLVLAHRRRLEALALGDRLAQALEEAERARRGAEAASLAKSRFLATMSHEVRTPLTAILGTVDLLRVGELDARQREHVQIVGQAGESLLELIDDVLDFSRLEAGHLEAPRVPLALDLLAEEAALLFAGAAAGKGIGLAVVVDPGLRGPRLGAPRRLRQVLVNLVGNAVKFTDVGSVLIRVTPAPGGLEGGVRIAVEDTGVGIAPEHAEAIFEAFVQADGTDSRRHGGTGLGLSIARRIVEGLGGSLGVRSRPGRGSVFHADLPLPAAGPAPARAARAGAVVTVGLEPFEQAVVDAQLGAAGLEVELAAGPEAAAARIGSPGAPEVLAVLLGQRPEAEAVRDLDAAARRLGERAPRLACLVPFGEPRGALPGVGASLPRPLRPSLLDALVAPPDPPPTGAAAADPAPAAGGV